MPWTKTSHLPNKIICIIKFLVNGTDNCLNMKIFIRPVKSKRFEHVLTLSTLGMRVRDCHVTTVQGQICPDPCLIGLMADQVKILC